MPTYVRTREIRHRIGRGGRLALKVVDAAVTLLATASDEALVEATFRIGAPSEGDADRVLEAAALREGRGSGWLEVEQRETGSRLAGRVGRLIGARPSVELDLRIELPPAAELRFEGVSADLRAVGLAGAQRYTTISGDLYLDESAGPIRIDSVSGDLTIRAAGEPELRVNSVSGDLSASAPRFRSLRISTVSGDVELEGAIAAGGEHRCETVSGDLSLGLLGDAAIEVRGISTDISSDLDHRIEGRLDRRRVVVGEGGPLLVFSSLSGDLAVHRPHRAVATGPEPAGDESLAVLRALERGEIDVDEAARRLEAER